MSTRKWWVAPRPRQEPTGEMRCPDLGSTAEITEAPDGSFSASVDGEHIGQFDSRAEARAAVRAEWRSLMEE